MLLRLLLNCCYFYCYCYLIEFAQLNCSPDTSLIKIFKQSGDGRKAPLMRLCFSVFGSVLWAKWLLLPENVAEHYEKFKSPSVGVLTRRNGLDRCKPRGRTDLESSPLINFIH